MKKIAIFLIALLSITTVMAVDPIVSVVPIVVGPVNPEPKVYLVSRDVDVGVGFDTSGQTVNPFDYRNGMYLFTGERVRYRVVVREESGVDAIEKVVWIKDGQGEVLCSPATFTIPSGVLPTPFDASIDKRYECVLTVEPSWIGTGTIRVRAYNVQGVTSQGSIEPAETWKFNPEVSFQVVTSDGKALQFENKKPGETAYLLDGQRLIVRNPSEVNMWVFIAGRDFTSTDTTAKCPTTNKLDITNLEYQSIAGTNMSPWTQMPRYSENAACTLASCRNANKLVTGNPADMLSPNSHLEVNLRLNYPVPCIGVFDNGELFVIAKAV